MDRITRQRTDKEIKDVNTSSQLDLTDIHRTLHLTTEYTFFSSAHGAFSRIDHILCQRTSQNKFKSFEIIQGMFSNHMERM